MSTYYTSVEQEYSLFLIQFDSYVSLPTGWFNIGDTIEFQDPRINKIDTIQ